MPHLCTGDFAIEEFNTLAQTASFPPESLLMGFSPAEARFSPWSGDLAFLRSSCSGRIFHPAGELSWRRLDETMRVVYLGDDPPPIDLNDRSDLLNGLQPSAERFLLWGIRTDLRPEWIEQQVPQRFSYPVTGKTHSRGRVAVWMERWNDMAGRPKFTRYQRIEEISGEPSHADW